MAKEQLALPTELEVIASSQFKQAKRRVIRQLTEALLYEGIVIFQEQQWDGRRAAEYRIIGQNDQGNLVSYVFEGERKLSFRRIRLAGTNIYRIDGEIRSEVEDIALFMRETMAILTEPPCDLEPFVYEIEQTLLKEAWSLYDRYLNRKVYMRPGGTTYADLEGEVLEGHPYHPCFKSRIGFMSG
ncbi:IucA/IucC family protein [Paenibacillus sp. FSL K6-2862]|uniref:IucA/IucC family protein n=1 Tax=Paenibacillus sp. FSL K6-2862 TaxID=2921484 RepID=UPI0030F51522